MNRHREETTDAVQEALIGALKNALHQNQFWKVFEVCLEGLPGNPFLSNTMKAYANREDSSASRQTRL